MQINQMLFSFLPNRIGR